MIEFGDAAELPSPSRAKFESHGHFSRWLTGKLSRHIAELKRTLSHRKQATPSRSNRQKIQFCPARFLHSYALKTGLAFRRATHV